MDARGEHIDDSAHAVLDRILKECPPSIERLGRAPFPLRGIGEHGQRFKRGILPEGNRLFVQKMHRLFIPKVDVADNENSSISLDFKMAMGDNCERWGFDMARSSFFVGWDYKYFRWYFKRVGIFELN